VSRPWRRYLIFDLFHTLVHGGDEERDRVVAEMAGILDVEPLALVRAYHDSWRERVVAPDLDTTVRDLAVRVGGSPSDAQVARAARLRHDLARGLLAAVSPATLACLERLTRQGWRLALVSNATADTAAAWPASALARHIPVVTFSCTVGAAKPAPEIFRHAVAALGAPAASACCYVGDGGDDELRAAAALGMTAIRTTEHNDTDPSWPGPTIGTLSVLPDLLP
jgi:putative hydrolase of the HAD superfamily